MADSINSKDTFPTVVLLAGGRGLRLKEEGDIPKPLVDIGGIPLVIHIMRWFESFGHRRFIICGGYKSELLNECWVGHLEPGCEVICLDTGNPDDVGTAGRLLRAKESIGDKAFLLSYGDSLSNIDLNQLASVHHTNGRAVTMTVVRPRISFGVVTLGADDVVTKMEEKPKDVDLWSNGGVFACEPRMLESISDESEYLERKPLERLAALSELQAYRHTGFRLPVDTPKDLSEARELWRAGTAPWSVVRSDV